MKTTHLFLVLSFISLGIPHLLQAQDGFVQGTIVLKSGEVLEGKIKYYSGENTPRSIDFLGEESLVPKTFSPLEVATFDIGSERYVGAVVEQEYSSRNDALLERESGYNILIDTTFLLVLIDGAFPLLMSENEGDITNFYIIQGEEPILLKYRKYLYRENGQQEIRESNVYQEQLADYTQACEDLDKEQTKLFYTQASLMDLFEAFYKCIGVKPTFVFKKKVLPKINKLTGRSPLPIRVGLKLGARQTRVSESYLQEDNRNYRTLEFEPSNNPIYGVYGEVFPIPKWERFSIHAEFLLSRFAFAAQETTLVIFRDVQAIYRTIEFNPLFRYYLIKAPFQLYVNAGISFNSDRLVQDSDIVTIRSISSTGQRNIPLFKSGFQGQLGVLGAGFRYKGWALEGRYMPIYLSTQRDHLLLSYDLFQFDLRI